MLTDEKGLQFLNPTNVWDILHLFTTLNGLSTAYSMQYTQDVVLDGIRTPIYSIPCSPLPTSVPPEANKNKSKGM